MLTGTRGGTPSFTATIAKNGEGERLAAVIAGAAASRFKQPLRRFKLTALSQGGALLPTIDKGSRQRSDRRTVCGKTGGRIG
jgi:hypothetical protein